MFLFLENIRDILSSNTFYTRRNNNNSDCTDEIVQILKFLFSIYNYNVYLCKQKLRSQEVHDITNFKYNYSEKMKNYEIIFLKNNSTFFFF